MLIQWLACNDHAAMVRISFSSDRVFLKFFGIGFFMEQHIGLAGRMLEFEGEEADYYFQNLPEVSQGAGERHLLRFAARHLHPTSTCLDIGARIGLTTAILALACPKGHVYAFEPSPKRAMHLRQNMTVNALSNTTVVERALGATCTKGPIARASPSANLAIVRDRDRQRSSDYDARTMMETIDNWSATLGSPIDFVNLNVEGYEAHILAGGAETIARDRPVIFMEFNSVAISFAARRSPLSFAETIWKLFDVFEVDGDGVLSALDVRLFVLNNMLRHGCVDDIVLDLKPDLDAQSIREVLADELEAEGAAA